MSMVVHSANAASLKIITNSPSAKRGASSLIRRAVGVEASARPLERSEEIKTSRERERVPLLARPGRLDVHAEAAGRASRGTRPHSIQSFHSFRPLLRQ